MLTKTRVIEQDRRAQSLGHVKTSWALCWYAWVVLFEHTFGVGQPEPDSQRPDGQVFRHKLPFVGIAREDRKSTRLNSSHSQISYAVFCLKNKNEHFHHLAIPLRAV